MSTAITRPGAVGSLLTLARRVAADRFGGLPNGFFVIVAATLINRAGTFTAPFLVLYVVDYKHLAADTVTPVLVCYGLGVLLSNPVGGTLADRMQRRTAIAAGLIAAATSQLALATAQGAIGVALAIFLLGLTSDLYRPAANAAVADLVPSGDRPRAFGLLHWALNLGVPIAALVSAGFVGRAWLLLFLLDAISSLFVAGLVLRKLPHTANRAASTVDGQPQIRAWRDGALLLTCLTAAITFAIYFQYAYTVPLHIVDAGMRPFDYGLVIALNGLLVAVVQPLAGPRLSRMPRRLGIVAGILLLSVGLASTGLAINLPLLLSTVAVWTLGEILTAALLPTLVADLAPGHAKGRYMGIFGAGIGAAGLVAPLGVAAYHAGSTVLWPALAALGLVLILVILPTIRLAESRLERASA